jgi:hypothetical protein
MPAAGMILVNQENLTRVHYSIGLTDRSLTVAAR